MVNKYFAERVQKEEQTYNNEINAANKEIEKISMIDGLEKLCKYIGLDKQIATAVEVVTVDEILHYFTELAEKK